MKIFSITCSLLLVGVLLLSSCVATKKITYLQDDPAGKISDQDALVKSMQLKSTVYRLKPADRLKVNIFSLTDEKLNFIKDPEMELRVDDTGQIRLPVMGPIAVSGLTVQEAEGKVKRVASEYLRSPEITIKLLNFNITILGEVNKQGTFNMAEPKVNILEAIGNAGGITDNANMKTIRIIRNENDTAKIYRINMLNDKLLASNEYFLHPNDIVIVDPVKAKATNQQRISLFSLFFSFVTTLILVFK